MKSLKSINHTPQIARCGGSNASVSKKESKRIHDSLEDGGDGEDSVEDKNSDDEELEQDSSSDSPASSSPNN